MKLSGVTILDIRVTLDVGLVDRALGFGFASLPPLLFINGSTIMPIKTIIPSKIKIPVMIPSIGKLRVAGFSCFV